jgi:NADPH2 dehydrogenase
MSNLFNPFKLKDLTIKNRIVMPPMCMYSAENGLANAFHLQHYATRAMGGVGLVIVEATGVVPNGRISDQCLGLWKDEQADALKAVVERVHDCGGKIGIQLNHAGRKTEVTSGAVQAPSALRFNEKYKVPEAMTHADIEATVIAFRDAAKRALYAGFDLIEIHAAHGYLINQFLSPLCNLRTDAYGGSAENRFRLLEEVIEAIRTVWPSEKPLSVRISAEEYFEGGLHADDLAAGLNAVKHKGIDLVNVSSGGVVSVTVPNYPGYQLEFARLIGSKTKLPTITGGRMTDARHAEDILGLEGIDLVFMGRALLRQPYWPLQAAYELGVDISWPKPYERAKF